MSETLQVGSIRLQIHRKAIKHLHISVMPPDGRIRVSAPDSMSETAIRTAVVSRIPWIRKQQRDFEHQPRQSKRALVTGESHYLWGRHYRLDVVEGNGQQGVTIARKGSILLAVRPATSPEARLVLLNDFYRREVKAATAKLLKVWVAKAGVELSDWGVKRMKTKWGSCNTDARRIWLNLELAKKPPECLEYILVHELVHLIERNHNDHFRSQMERLMPNWQERRNLLNSLPLAHEHWIY